jgi:hypothetical protein
MLRLLAGRAHLLAGNAGLAQRMLALSVELLPPANPTAVKLQVKKWATTWGCRLSGRPPHLALRFARSCNLGGQRSSCKSCENNFGHLRWVAATAKVQHPRSSLP